MKKIIRSFLIIVLFVLFSCSANNSTEPTVKQDGKLQLSFTNSILNGNLSKTLSGSISNVVVDIESSNGQIIYSNEKISLFNMNGEYISEPISLVSGNYKLTKFLVTDATDSVIYATPLASSQAALLVNNPLAISFSVEENKTKKIIPEVISTTNMTADDFGYITFGFRFVKTINFMLSVFVYNDTLKNFKQAAAKISIIGDSEEIYSGNLLSETNGIAVKDSCNSYSISISKDGYDIYTHQFNSDELKSYSSNPLEVILEPIDLSLYTKLLLNGDGVHGQSVFVDSSSQHKTVTPYGNTITNTTVKKNGSASIDFDGADDYLEIANSEDFDFGTGDFTIDCFVNFRALPNNNTAIIYSKRNNWNEKSFELSYLTYNGYNYLSFSLNNTTILLERVWTPTLNIWYHIAVVRTNSKLLLFIDGVLKSTQSITEAVFNTSYTLKIGAGSNMADGNIAQFFFDGYIDDLRICKGVARWTSDFSLDQ